MEHHFKVEEAIKYGVEKAVILSNLRFWLEKNKANKKNVYEKDGVDYYWTYNSGSAFAELFPYMSSSSILRWLKELEDDKVIISGCFNKTNYDRTKWYSMDSYSISQNEKSISQNDQPIPYNKPDIKSSVLSKESTESVDKIDPEEQPLSSFGFPLPEGYKEDSIADDDREYHILLDPHGNRVKPSEVSKLRKQYEVRKRIKTPLKSPNINRQAIMADKILKKYAELCEREVGVTPKYGYKEKMAFTQAVKKYGAENFAKVCIWFVQSDAKDEDKICPLLCTWTRTINNYQLDTGNKL